MKRLTKRLLREVNHESELLTPKYLRSTGISKLVGPNYVYFTNGHLMKVYLEDGGVKYVSEYPNGLIFPISTYIKLWILKNILKDLKEIRRTL